MTEAEAYEKAQTYFGKRAHVIDSGLDSNDEMRSLAWKQFREEQRKLTPNSRLVRQLRRKVDRHRYMVGTISFAQVFLQEGEGDTWEQAFERLARRFKLDNDYGESDE